MSSPKRVVIVGGGFAGLACAQKLANDKRLEVTLIDRRNHHLFQPLLYQVATASLAAPDIARSLRGILRKAKNVRVILDEVTAIKPRKHEVHTTNGVYPYDYAVLATGARSSFFGNDQWEEHTVGLKSLEDAQEIRRRVLNALERAERSESGKDRRKLMTIVIVGGGPTGVELAGAFSDLVRRALRSDFRRIDPARLRILLVQSGDRILKPYSPDLSDWAKRRLEALGVEVCLHTRVDQIEDGRVHLDSGEWIEAETIIWAAGVQATGITAQLKCEKDRAGRIKVEKDLSAPGHRNLFVAGDIAAVLDEDGKEVPGLAPAAEQMGRHIAKVIKEDLRLEKTQYADRKDEFRPAFRYLDKGIMAIIGKNCAVVEAGSFKLRGLLAWLTWLFIHLLFLIGFRNKVIVLLQWAWAYLVDQPGARVVTAGTKPEPIR